MVDGTRERHLLMPLWTRAVVVLRAGLVRHAALRAPRAPPIHSGERVLRVNRLTDEATLDK
jgi:hypothetical protein